MKLVVAVRVLSVFAVAELLLPITAIAQDVSALANWPAPLVWSLTPKPAKEPPPSEVEPLSAAAVPTSLLPFVGIPPCRLADTRGNGFAGQYGPPAITPSGRDITIVGQCGIPAEAQAVSFNFTAANVSAAGFLVAYPAGAAFPPVATMAYDQNTPNLSNAAVVPLGTDGAITVVAGVTTIDVIIDVNGYYGPDLDSVCVNEGQANSVTSSMIVDGTIVDADINASAAIADTKLATIMTAGKVADTALSANVTKLGQTIEAIEITNIMRSISIPLMSFVDCQSEAFLDLTNGADPIADFIISPVDGAGIEISFDATVGNEDQNSEICSQLSVPADYVAGGAFRVRTRKTNAGLATEVLNCTVNVNSGGVQAAGTVEIDSNASTSFVCTPTIAALAWGDRLNFSFSITSSATMDQPVVIQSVAFEYTASQ
jgi:hypothetical protein